MFGDRRRRNNTYFSQTVFERLVVEQTLQSLNADRLDSYTGRRRDIRCCFYPWLATIDLRNRYIDTRSHNDRLGVILRMSTSTHQYIL